MRSIFRGLLIFFRNCRLFRQFLIVNTWQGLKLWRVIKLPISYVLRVEFVQCEFLLRCGLNKWHLFQLLSLIDNDHIVEVFAVTVTLFIRSVELSLWCKSCMANLIKESTADCLACRCIQGHSIFDGIKSTYLYAWDLVSAFLHHLSLLLLIIHDEMAHGVWDSLKLLCRYNTFLSISSILCL